MGGFGRFEVSECVGGGLAQIIANEQENLIKVVAAYGRSWRFIVGVLVTGMVRFCLVEAKDSCSLGGQW